MNQFPVIIDCDPGVDDTAALLLAGQLPEMDLRGITTVGGNVNVEKTTANAIKVRYAMGKQIPIFKGANKPMFCQLVTAEEVHSEDGFGGVIFEVPEEYTKIEEESAWDAMYRIGKECHGELVIVATAPLTNLGLALAKYNDFSKYIKRVVIMGGAAIGGNVTPSAEFNTYVDPEAADMLFTSGIPVYMCGLDVTMKAYLTRQELEEIRDLGSMQGQLFYDVLQKIFEIYENVGKNSIAVHDATAVIYAVDDSMFETEHVWVRVETKGQLTRGKTVTDLYSDKQLEKNAYIVTKVDRLAFVKKVKEVMARYS